MSNSSSRGVDLIDIDLVDEFRMAARAGAGGVRARRDGILAAA